jgi:hypothetical protein
MKMVINYFFLSKISQVKYTRYIFPDYRNMEAPPRPSAAGLKFSLQTIPAEKLLHYVPMKELQSLAGEDNFKATQQRVRQAGMKLTAKNIKALLANDQLFIGQLRNTETGRRAFEK